MDNLYFTAPLFQVTALVHAKTQDLTSSSDKRSVGTKTSGFNNAMHLIGWYDEDL